MTWPVACCIATGPEVGVKVPVVARLTGTNQQEALDILKGSKILFADDMSAAVRKVIEVAK